MAVLRLNMDEVAIGDLEDFEEYTGTSITEIDRAIMGESVSMKVLTGMALLALRQTNPDATIADAKRVKVSEMMAVGDDDPTEAEPVALEPLRTSTGRKQKTTA